MATSIIDLQAEQCVVKYTASDDLVITATVLETVSGVEGPIIWGTVASLAQVREYETDAAAATTFTVDTGTNGKLTISMPKATVWTTLGQKKWKFSVQITRNGSAFTYMAGVLEPRVEATHP